VRYLPAASLPAAPLDVSTAPSSSPRCTSAPLSASSTASPRAVSVPASRDPEAGIPAHLGALQQPKRDLEDIMAVKRI
jgi:hypothetical protein